MPLNRTCPQCGSSHAKAQRFCSRACYVASNVGSAHPNHKPRAQRVCEQCGGGFETYPYLERRFCSRSCRSRWTSANVPRRLRTAPRISYPCPGCGAAVTVLASRADRNKHCSAGCARRGQALRVARLKRGEMRACIICGTDAYVVPSRPLTARFCSGACYHVWRAQQPRTSTSRDSAAYREWRAAVYRRDKYTCQRCGERSTRKNRLHAHHIKYWADYPELRFEVSNGLLLCGSCHAKEHFNVSVLQHARRG
jgi:5-methylcytosine-specific restriction endonuclease McrA